MLTSNGPDAILCDMDGTLVDSIPLWRALDRQVLAEYGHDLTDDILDAARHHLTGSMAGVMRFREAILEALGAPCTVGWFSQVTDQAMARRMREGVPWMPGARQLLDAARTLGLPTALVTTSPRVIADAWLASHDHPFDAVVSGDEVEQGKPHPEPYLTAARILGVRPRSCVAFEDTVNGYASAHTAGCTVFMVSPWPHEVERRVPTLEHVNVARLRHLF